MFSESTGRQVAALLIRLWREMMQTDDTRGCRDRRCEYLHGQPDHPACRRRRFRGAGSNARSRQRFASHLRCRGAVHFDGRDSAAATKTYVEIVATTLDATSASEHAKLLVKAVTAGAIATIATIGPWRLDRLPDRRRQGRGHGQRCGGIYINGAIVAAPSASSFRIVKHQGQPGPR